MTGFILDVPKIFDAEQAAMRCTYPLDYIQEMGGKALWDEASGR